MSETEVIQQEQEVKKKKKKLSKEEIEERKRKLLIRKRLRNFTTPINYKVLKTQINDDILFSILMKQFRVYERKKLIFNLLIKAWYGPQGKVKCRFGFTSKAAEVGSKISIILINKYHFILKGLDDMNYKWSEEFKSLLEKQFSDHRYSDFPTRVVSRTKKNRFILEKVFWDL